ncbi:MAG: Tetracycline resistance protein, class B [Chlamydiia bacterium]|nr:Tetracycline resistance protein, class B [Chlamydiia bacterium]
MHLLPRQKTKSLFAIFLTFAIDYLGATIIFPIFAPLFLSHEHSLFTKDFSDNARGILLGIFLASFPLAQFFFSPIIGEFADRSGRKRTFLLTIISVIVGYFLSAWAIDARNLPALFGGRFLMGLAAGNMSVCLASIIDLSATTKEKIRYFTMGSAVAGIAFVVGPFLGGKLSDPTLCPIFGPSFPMWIGGYLAVANFFIILFLFHETLHAKAHGPFDFLKAYHNVQSALRTPTIKNLYVSYFFYFFSWNMVFQFIPALLVEVFGSNMGTIGDVTALMGVIWIVGTLVMSRLIHTHRFVKPALYTALVVFAVATALSGFQRHLVLLLVISGVGVFFAGGMWPIFASAISGAAEKHMQGRVMGLSQSIQSLAMIIAPLLGGLFFHLLLPLPFMLASLAAVFAIWTIWGVPLKLDSSTNG